MALDLRSSELEHNFIKERISNVEKHLSEINLDVNSYMKCQAHLRDSGDKLAKTILRFASKEILNQSLRTAMGEFSDLLSAVQEYRDAQIQRTELKVVLEFSNYSHICKQAKIDLKKCFEARAKELNKKNALEKVRSKNPTNWQKITQVEKEVSQAQDVASRTTWELSKQMDEFERRKIEDIKKIFMEFIKIEMMFHCKSIELYTKAFNVMKNVNTEADLKAFRSHFKAHTSTLDAESLRPFTDETVKPNAEDNLSSPASNSSMKPSTSKGAQRLQRSILTQKLTPLKLEYSPSSVNSTLDSKLEFGDHS